LYAVPVFLYAAAHPTGKSVGAIRRELGYYRPNYKENQWAGSMLPDVLPIMPDVGPTNVPPERGAITVGATPFLEGYNVPILSKDIATVRRITRRLTGRGGGLPQCKLWDIPRVMIAQRSHVCWIQIMSMHFIFKLQWSRVQQNKDLKLRMGTTLT
jgi:glutamate formiminotransferase